jgi:hypothetical protein
MPASWHNYFAIFTISNVLIHITFLGAFLRSKKLFNVGFSWHVSWLCFLLCSLFIISTAHSE